MVKMLLWLALRPFDPLMDDQMWAGDLALWCDRQQGVGG